MPSSGIPDMTTSARSGPIAACARSDSAVAPRNGWPWISAGEDFSARATAPMNDGVAGWLKLLALDGDLAKAEPKTLRYRLLHAARLVRGGRRRTLKIAATWPWADEIVTAWQRVQAIPHPL
jgi:Transposase DDE domain group 1